METAGEVSCPGRTRHEISAALLETMDASSLKQVPLPAGFGSARGSEHEVWFFAADNSVVKATHGGECGRAFGPKPFAVFDDYLKRVAMTREIFGIEWKVIGVHGEGRRMRIVTTQPAIRGRAATLGEIYDFMTFRGFALHHTHFGDAWYRRTDNMLVSDAEPNNVLATENGLVPIDVIVTKPSLLLLKEAGIDP